MSLPSAPRVVAIPVFVLLGLTGCTAAPPTETYVDAPVEQTPETVTPNPIEPDTMLIVRATATATNGAQLSLELQVHQSRAWDYAGTQTLPAALIEDCAGSLTDETFSSGAWSFTRANITAIPTAGSTADWPADLSVSIEPSTEYAMISGRGMLVGTAEADAPLCLTSKSFAGAGKGAFALGIPGDAAVLTGWARHAYGFAIEAATLSDCSFESTDVGAQFGANVDWIELKDDATCVIGPADQKNEY